MKDFLLEDSEIIEDRTESLTFSPVIDFPVADIPFQTDISVLTDGFLRLTMLVKVEKYCSETEGIKSS